METLDNTLTKVKCTFTSCKHNSSCCMGPCDSHDECVCTCKTIEICTDDKTGDWQCCQWEYGHKTVQCVECQLKSSGEIMIPDVENKFDFIDEDLFDLDDDEY